MILQWFRKKLLKIQQCKLASKNSYKMLAKDCSSYIVYLAWLQYSTRELQWFEYLKLVFSKYQMWQLGWFSEIRSHNKVHRASKVIIIAVRTVAMWKVSSCTHCWYSVHFIQSMVSSPCLLCSPHNRHTSSLYSSSKVTSSAVFFECHGQKPVPKCHYYIKHNKKINLEISSYI